MKLNLRKKRNQVLKLECLSKRQSIGTKTLWKTQVHMIKTEKSQNNKNNLFRL